MTIISLLAESLKLPSVQRTHTINEAEAFCFLCVQLQRNCCGPYVLASACCIVHIYSVEIILLLQYM